jgi:Fe-S-cluster-containing dehydrogenase component/DMSO reductase anchor subunit
LIPLQKSFVFDVNRCTGCQACGVACKVENGTPPEIDWRQVLTFNELRHPELPVFHLSMACNHCVDPPCLEYCPALAYNKDAGTGAVTIDADKCIGCRYCSWNCPYDAPRFNTAKGVMEKCTFCNHRLAEGTAPACVTGCPTGALGIEDYRTGTGNGATPGFTHTAIRPALRIIPLRPGAAIPEAAFAGIDAGDYAASIRKPAPKITARSEWTLVAFTLMAAAMVALHTAGLAGRPVIPAWLFLGAGASAMILSTLHLGRKLRAFRALLNWRRSWLSREILCFSAFYALAAVYLAAGSRPSGYAALLFGMCALVSIDQVYRVMAVRGQAALHSAQAVWTAPLLAGIFLDLPSLAATAGTLKLALYAQRKLRSGTLASAGSIARFGLGFLLPAGLIAAGAGMPPVTAYVLAGELIDRCEFYSGLDIISPARQVQLDEERTLRSRR